MRAVQQSLEVAECMQHMVDGGAKQLWFCSAALLFRFVPNKIELGPVMEYTKGNAVPVQ